MRLHRPTFGLLFVTLGFVSTAACSSLIGADAPTTRPAETSDAAADVSDVESGKDGEASTPADVGVVDGPDAVPVCAELTDSATDVFVASHTIGAKATGTRECPFPTIGEGLAAAERSLETAKVVHVGPGRYANEVFPLRVKGGISIVGADVDHASELDDTVISGSGPYTTPIDGIAARATLLIGDKSGVSSLENLTIDGGGDLAARYGVVCDQGPEGATREHAPNVTLKSIDVHGYVATASVGSSAVLVTTTSAQSGCQLRLLSSRIHDSHNGLDAIGCNLTGSGGPVTLEVGNGTAAGANDFYALGEAETNAGWGLRIADCVTYASVRGNTFRSTPGGLEVSQEDHARIKRGYVEINDNHFRDLTNWGIAVIRSSVIAELQRNDLRRVLSVWTYPAAALLLDSAFEGGSSLPGRERPRIAHARSNLIVGNDVGLDIRNFTTMNSDFGTPGDHGLNTFACNDRLRYTDVAGYDVMLVATREGDAVLPMEGNYWDHAPVVPTRQEIDGADVYSYDVAAPDTEHAAVDPAACAKVTAP